MKRNTKYFNKFLNDNLKSITKESFHLFNSKSDVIYPYITYEIVAESTDPIREEYEVIMNLWDVNSGIINLLDLQDKLFNHFDRATFKDDTHIINSRVARASDIATGNEQVKRKEIRVYFKVDNIGDEN